ncbi:MAG: GNAT family N-acetyltransferase [Mesorhizobium amorphae]|nr:MAG: GNAT family N-acetyltransferase [Mesorhizobium amorphae]
MVAEQELETGFPGLCCPVLTTERLVLRPPHPDDADELTRLANNRRVAEMLARMPHPYTPRHAAEFIARNGGAESCTYAVTLAESGAFVGCAALDPAHDGNLVIGYWIGEPFWNRGFATEAAHALVDIAFRNSDVEVLHASCRVLNIASRRVIHKCGFQYAGEGMIHSVASGRVAVERYRLDRRTWVGLRSWNGAAVA